MLSADHILIEQKRSILPNVFAELADATGTGLLYQVSFLKMPFTCQQVHKFPKPRPECIPPGCEKMG